MDTIDNINIIEAVENFLNEVKGLNKDTTTNYQIVDLLQLNLKRYGYKISKDE